VHPGDECGGIVQHPVLEGPRQRSRLAGAVAVMAQIGEPNVEPLRTEEMRQPSAWAVQECAVVRESAVHEQYRGPPVAMGAEPVQGQVHPVDRRNVPRAHS